MGNASPTTPEMLSTSMSPLRVLIVDDEPAARFGMARALAKLPCEIHEAKDGAEALERIAAVDPQLAFVDLNMPRVSGQGLLERLGSERLKDLEVIVVTADDSIQAAVSCMRLGASDYITKPFEIEQLRAIARRAIERRGLHGQISHLQNQLNERRAFGALVGVSRAMGELFDQIERAAKAPLDVLVVGETGTGKELIARELHRRSDRHSGPFVAVNASAVSPTLAESELFGHSKGAFTGASSKRRGVFEQAHGGTLFMDEIGDMSVDLQAKILRVLQQRVVQPVGSDNPVPVDVRVVCATHQDLATAIDEGRFRQDLFYRVKGIRLQVPPLRERLEDVIPLAEYFLQRFAVRTAAATAPRLATAAIERLLGYSWPGNVRELEHVVTAAASMRCGEQITAADLDLTGPMRPAAKELEIQGLFGLPLTEAKQRLTTWFERTAIGRALETHGGNVSAAARSLGVHRQSLQQKMTQLGLRHSAIDRGE